MKRAKLMIHVPLHAIISLKVLFPSDAVNVVLTRYAGMIHAERADCILDHSLYDHSTSADFSRAFFTYIWSNVTKWGRRVIEFFLVQHPLLRRIFDTHLRFNGIAGYVIASPASVMVRSLVMQLSLTFLTPTADDESPLSNEFVADGNLGSPVALTSRAGMTEAGDAIT